MKFLQGCYLFWQYLHSHLPAVSQLHCLTLLLFILLAVYTRTGLYSRMNYRDAAIPRSLSYDFSIPFISFSFLFHLYSMVKRYYICKRSAMQAAAADRPPFWRTWLQCFYGALSSISRGIRQQEGRKRVIWNHTYLPASASKRCYLQIPGHPLPPAHETVTFQQEETPCGFQGPGKNSSAVLWIYSSQYIC